jgi:hypothetical protein
VDLAHAAPADEVVESVRAEDLRLHLVLSFARLPHILVQAPPVSNAGRSRSGSDAERDSRPRRLAARTASVSGQPSTSDAPPFRYGRDRRGVTATARVLIVLPAFAVLLVGTAGAVDEPALLAGLLGTAVLLLGSARTARRVVASVAGPTPPARGHRRVREGAALPRQCDPDAAGRIRARAPAGAPQTV